MATGSDVSPAKTELANPETLCKYALKDANNKCNEISYTPGMTVDSDAKLVRCDFTANQRCNYTNTDNTTYSNPCECGLNDAGSSWCPASTVESIIHLNI